MYYLLWLKFITNYYSNLLLTFITNIVLYLQSDDFDKVILTLGGESLVEALHLDGQKGAECRWGISIRLLSGYEVDQLLLDFSGARQGASHCRRARPGGFRLRLISFRKPLVLLLRLLMWSFGRRLLIFFIQYLPNVIFIGYFYISLL